MVGGTGLVSPVQSSVGSGVYTTKASQPGIQPSAARLDRFGRTGATPHNGGDTAAYGVVTVENGGITEKNERVPAGPREKPSQCTP